MKQTALDQLLEKIIARMECGELPWRQPWRNSACPLLPTRADGEPFSGANLWLLAMQMAMNGWESPRFYTFNQAKALGGMVRKGEKGAPAILYKTREIESDEGDDPKVIRFLRSYVVFNSEQIEGLPQECYAVPDKRHPDPDAINTFLASIDFKLLTKGDMAYYSPDQDMIVMPHVDQFVDKNRFNSVLAHEMIHWTGAKHRLDRKLENYRYRDCRAREELVAEMGSLQLGFLIGLPVEDELMDNHAGYLQSWVRLLKDQPAELIKASGLASRAVDFLISQSRAGVAPVILAA